MGWRDEGVVCNCSLCDSYFVLITGGSNPADYRGKAGTKVKDDRNEKLQQRWGERGWLMLRCPTCVELASGLRYLDWMERHGHDFEMATPLSPCWAVSWAEGELPALFEDHRTDAGGGKPKWALASGVGPAGLELDASRSGRLWKSSLRPVGITAPRYDGDEQDAAWHAEVVRQLDIAFATASVPVADSLAERLHAIRPAFGRDHWPQVSEEVAELVAMGEEAGRVREEGSAQKGFPSKKGPDRN